MQEYPKQIRQLLTEHLVEAYERELQRELTKLDASISEWRNGKIGSGELSQLIHEYERGPSRALFQRYNSGPKDMTLAYVIVAGILRRDEVPEKLLEALERPLSFYQMLKNRDELRAPDDFSGDQAA